MTPTLPSAGGRTMPAELVASKGKTAQGTKRTVDIAAQATRWLTPHGMSGQEAATGRQGAGGEFARQATQWPTPSAAVMNDGEDPGQWEARRQTLKDKGINGNGAGLPLTVATVRWPTPTASADQGPDSSAREGSPTLASTIAAWPTPRATTRPGDSGSAKRHLQGPNPGLNDMATAWPTPNARDHKGTDLSSRRGGASLSHATQTGEFSHSSPQARPTSDGPESSPPRPISPLRLNPAFAEWLMGWSIGWTVAEPSASSASETGSWRRRLQRHLLSLLGERG